MEQKKNNGFLYVASLEHCFITAARYSASSLKDYWPESNITLFTHKEWVTEADYDLFDNIITEDVPYHKRSKLWALDRTPYDLTCYIDCDTEIMHEDIQYIFDQHNIENDITLTKVRDYAASTDNYFNGGSLTDHCGLFVYNSKPRTLSFMNMWWHLYCDQQDKQAFNIEAAGYPTYLRQWDQFTFWYLQNKTDYKIKRGYFPDPDAKWNFVHIYRQEELQGHDMVICHRTIPNDMRD